MKKTFIYMIVLLAASTLTLSAQKKEYISTLNLEAPRVEKVGDMVTMNARVTLTNPGFHRQQMVTLTPVLRSTDGSRRMIFEPLVFMGQRRARIIDREIRLGNFAYDRKPSQVVVMQPGSTVESVLFSLNAPYEPWMRSAELVFEEHATGCAGRVIADNVHRAISPILRPVHDPRFEVAYVTPPAEEVKQRSATYTARINFRVNRYEILHDFMNNAQVLDEVNRIITEVKGDPNLTITRFSVTGFASPEGPADHNLTLSKNRANAFVDYIVSRHGIDRNIIDIDWKGDDWDGLRKLMQESDFEGRDQVLNILDTTTDSNQRKSKLIALGPIYRELLNTYYPLLRRNEYTISYIARPFSVEEAKTVIRTRPQQLSLNEMFLVANTFPKGSPEFKEVFDIAVRLFPNDPYANLNSAALEIENGVFDRAMERLQGINMPEAWNNLGYIYALTGQPQRAAELFRRAADAGNAIAANNLRELNLWLESAQ